MALSVSEYSAFRGGDFQGIKVYRSDEYLEAAQGTSSGAVIHRFDKPTRLFLGMVASRRALFRFARQDPRSLCSTTSIRLNFRLARKSEIWPQIGVRFRDDSSRNRTIGMRPRCR